MRSPSLFVVAAVVSGGLVSACNAPVAPLAMSCVSRFDCSESEVCSNGQCVSQVTTKKPDAGTPDSGVVLPDVGFSNTPDTGNADSGSSPDAGFGMPDTGSSAPDAMPHPDAAPVIPDAGCMGAPEVTVAGTAYCSISAAINAAPAGATVIVPAATFNEAIDVGKALTIRGAGTAAARSVINGPGGGSLAIRLHADNVVFEGFEINAAGGIGVELSGLVTMRDIVLIGAVGTAMEVRGGASTRVTLTQLRIPSVAANAAGDGLGIWFDSGTTGTLENCEISDTYTGGIDLYNARVTLTGTRVLGAGADGCNHSFERCWPAIYAYSGSALIVNASSEIRNSGAAGIAIEGSSLEMTNSTSFGNGVRMDLPVDGIFLDGPTSSIITNNTISNNRGYGVGCWVGSNVGTCSNNTHTNNGAGWTNCGGC